MTEPLKGVSREASCTGKERFANGARAYRVSRRRERRTGIVGDTYRCHFCGGWHIGAPADHARPVTEGVE